MAGTGSWTAVPTPLGEFLVAAHGGAIVRIQLPGDGGVDRLFEALEATFPETGFARDDRDPLLRRAAAEVKEYAAGRLDRFTFPVNLVGTEFQRRVWNELRRIPYGKTLSYGEVASRIGKPGAARAVGQANHHNPVPLVVPCHRVIAAGGGLGGYGGGEMLKERLLAIEGALQ